MTARLTSLVHRVHRLFGSVFALLLAVWFVSGAVMTFAAFPHYGESERLASAPPLPRDVPVTLPPPLRTLLQHGGLERGTRPRLSMLEGEPTWTAPDHQGVRHAFRASALTTTSLVSPLDEVRVRAEVARHSAAAVREVERVDVPDQWSVGLARPGALPFYRVYLDDEVGEQLYLSARTGEIIQNSTRAERGWSWVGAIPHWIYPTLLRQERLLWRDTVLVLSALGLVVSVSGMLAGVWLWRARRRKHITRVVRDPWLRWHQYLGLSFGVLVSTWIFSGALSLSPFDWTRDTGPGLHEKRSLAGVMDDGALARIGAALLSCQRELDVRELELAGFARRLYVVCYGAHAQTRLIDLHDVRLTVRPRVDESVFVELSHTLSSSQGHARLSKHHAYDAYYYPKHHSPRSPPPYYKLGLWDADATTLYLDPQRARVAMRYTRLGRLERWLYHGLHSLDVPALYTHTALWRTVVITLMTVGAALSTLGLMMSVRKILRKRSRKRRV